MYLMVTPGLGAADEIAGPIGATGGSTRTSRCHGSEAFTERWDPTPDAGCARRSGEGSARPVPLGRSLRSGRRRADRGRIPV